MISVNTTGDINDRLIVGADLQSPNGKYHWILSLTTKDLPPKFENASIRDIDISIVSCKDIDPNTPDLIFLPVTLVGVVRIGDHVKSYYQNRLTPQTNQMAPGLIFSGYDHEEAANYNMIEDPFIRMEFKAVTQQTRDTMNSQNFSSQDQNDMNDQARTMHREHVDKNESANGGIDLPVGVQKSDTEEQIRETTDIYK